MSIPTDFVDANEEKRSYRVFSIRNMPWIVKPGWKRGQRSLQRVVCMQMIKSLQEGSELAHDARVQPGSVLGQACLLEPSNLQMPCHHSSASIHHGYCYPLGKANFHFHFHFHFPFGAAKAKFKGHASLFVIIYLPY